MEQVEITKEHLDTLRSKYDCNGMDDAAIIKAILYYQRHITPKGVRVLVAICFPDFQSYLNHIKTN